MSWKCTQRHTKFQKSIWKPSSKAETEFCFYLSFVTIWEFSFVTIWLFAFCHYLSLWVLSCNIVYCSKVQCNIVLCSTIQYTIFLCSIVLCNIVLFSTVQFNIVTCSPLLQHNIVFEVQCSVTEYMAVQWIVWDV